MKANGAPEKIYIFDNPILDFTRLSVRQSNDDIEYIRKDAFIEKVINFLNYKLDDVVAIRMPGTLIPHYVAKQELIDDFKNHIKGEKV